MKMIEKTDRRKLTFNPIKSGIIPINENLTGTEINKIGPAETLQKLAIPIV